MDPQIYKAFWLFVPLSFLAWMAFTYSERRRQVLRESGIIVFRPIGVVRLTYVWSVTLGIGFICGPSMYLARFEPWSVVAGTVTLVIATAMWPPSLYVGRSGLTSRRWWGGATEICWDEVAEITYDYHGFRTIVTSGDGRRIEHTLIDSDPERFQSEVVARAEHHLAIV